MTPNKLVRATVLGAFFVAAANAGIIGGSSSYGNDNSPGAGSSMPEPCTSMQTSAFAGFSFSCSSTGGATIMAEAFQASNPTSTDDVYDFEVTNAPANYTFTITPPTATPIVSGNSGSVFGLFYSSTCTSATSPQCSNELPPGVTPATTTYGTLMSNGSVSFPVNGAVAGDNTFVFFVLLDDMSGATTVNVNATLTPASATPEPNTLLLVCFGSLTLVVFRRRLNSRAVL